MGFVEYIQDQPDEVMDGAALDTALAAAATRTAAYQRDNFRARGLDRRVISDDHFVESAFSLHETVRASQTLSASKALLAYNSYNFESGDFAYDNADMILLQYSVFFSSNVSGATLGITAGDEPRVVIQYSTNSGSSWTDMAESMSGIGGASGLSSENGGAETEPHHGTLNGFAVFTAVSSQATLRFRLAIWDAQGNTNAVYMEDCRFFGMVYHQVV